MLNPMLLRIAECLWRDALGAAEGDECLVVNDGSVDPELVEAVVWAAQKNGLQVQSITYLPTAPWDPMSRFGRFARASLAESPPRLMPEGILAAMRAVPYSVLLVSNLELMFDLVFREACGAGRVAWIPYATPEGFLRLLPTSEPELAELAAQTTRAATALASCRTARLTTKPGTDLELAFGDYRTNGGTGGFGAYGPESGFQMLPGGQASRAPDLGTVHGVVVIDGSLGAPFFEAVDAPIRLEVVAGNVVGIEGGLAARRLESYLASLDPAGNAYNLTELGIGTNPLCHFAGLSGPNEDTHTEGFVSVALGADVHLGGDTRAGCHLDMTMSQPTLVFDGGVVIEDGELRLG